MALFHIVKVNNSIPPVAHAANMINIRIGHVNQKKA